ncbi:MAG: putative porin, partial [Flavobacteriales bacterium]
DSLFYSQFFPVDSSMLVTDSAHFSVLRNEIYLTSYAQGRKSGISVKRKFYFLAGVKHDLYKYSQYVFDTAFQNLSCELDISWKPFDFVQLRARSEYGVYGYHEGDGAIWPEITFYGKSKRFLLHINSMFTSTTPPLDVLRYHTKHIDWNNQFDAENTKVMKVRFEIPGRRFALYANYFSFGNYIYYDMQALPQQQPGMTEVAEFGIEKSMNWRHLHLDTKTAYQHSYNEELLSIPELVTCNSLYFEGPMFRKAVLVRLGVDVLYYSKYYPDAWMPLIRQYYLQGEKEVGNYPYAGALLAVKISNVRIFFRANHPYAGLMGYQYYGTPHHPMPDRTFRFGINWRFFD